MIHLFVCFKERVKIFLYNDVRSGKDLDPNPDSRFVSNRYIPGIFVSGGTYFFIPEMVGNTLTMWVQRIDYYFYGYIKATFLTL